MYTLDSVLYMLVFQMLGGSPQAYMEHAWRGLADYYYTKHRVEAQFTNLKLGIFHHAGNYPKLSGKGADVKALVLALRHVWQEHCISFLRHHMLVQAMLQNQCEVQDLLAHHKRQHGAARC